LFQNDFDSASQYSRSLGTERPKSVVALESVIWKAIFDIARGEIDVYDAAQVISDAIRGILNTVKPGDNIWFHLGSLAVYVQLMCLLTHICS
jgi:hypothetical protein